MPRTGNIQPQLDLDEHREIDSRGYKASLIFGIDSAGDPEMVETDGAGSLLVDVGKLNLAVSGYSADITTTAQEIAFSGGDITIPANTKGIIIQNDDADNIIYLGGSTVTSAGANAAYALNNQGDSMSFNNIGTSFSVYVIGSAAGTQLRITYM